MKALKIVFWIVGLLVAIVLIPPLFMPKNVQLEKSLVMDAPPEVIFDQVNCFENWEPWTPWAEVAINVVYEGPSCGEGATMRWDDGNGQSSQIITESIEYELIRTELQFMEQGAVWSDWTFEETAEGTLVTWGLRGDANYPFGRWINVLFITPAVGKSYVQGLNALNEYTRDMASNPSYITGEVGIKEVLPVDALAIRVTCSMEEIEAYMSQSFEMVMTEASNAGLQMTGPPFSIWYQWEGDTFEFDNCIPVSGKTNTTGDVKNIRTYDGKVISVVHTGHYNTTGNSWEALENYLKENDLESNGDPWEVYLTNPQQEPDPAKWMTELVWPVK
jgi:effector-binding domain-containing protein